MPMSAEQEFRFLVFRERIKQLNREQSQEALVDLYKQMIVKETEYQQLLKKQWGIQ